MKKTTEQLMENHMQKAHEENMKDVLKVPVVFSDIEKERGRLPAVELGERAKVVVPKVIRTCYANLAVLRRLDALAGRYTVAICIVLSGLLTDVLAAAQEGTEDASASSCERWSSDEFFESATAAQIAACLDAGEDANAHYDAGYGPLHWAVSRDNSDAVRTLLEAGADVDGAKAGAPTPLSFAKSAAVAQMLLSQNADLEFVGFAPFGTPMHMAASGGKAFLIEMLIEAGADVEARGANGQTPLHSAAGGYSESRLAVEVLLRAGADVTASDDFGMTPLQSAARRNKNPEVLKLLLAAGAERNERTEDGRSLLHLAAESNESADVIGFLLANGSVVNARDIDGATPLHKAGANRNAAVVRALVAAGADLDARDRHGNTPLHAAVGWVPDQSSFKLLGYDGESVATLLDLGASPSARNGKGRTPWDLAQENEALKGTNAYWRLNDARFAVDASPEHGTIQVERRRQGDAPATSPRTCEIPGYPRPSNAQDLGLSWCGSNVGFPRRRIALQAAGAWCAIVNTSSSSRDQIAARHREISTACDMLDSLQSSEIPPCQCPTIYRS